MGCNCGQKTKNVEYEVKLKDGSTRRFTTVTDAQTAIRQAKGGTMRAVKAA